MTIHAARGKALDRLGAMYGVTRGPARFWRWRLPWRQMDRTFRARIRDRVLALGPRCGGDVVRP